MAHDPSTMLCSVTRYQSNGNGNGITEDLVMEHIIARHDPWVMGHEAMTHNPLVHSDVRLGNNSIRFDSLIFDNCIY